jgi:hypothetical protein
MRENDGKVTSVSAYLCERYKEAIRLCYFLNHLALDGGDKLAARLVEMNKEYPLEIHQPFTFDDLAQTDDRKIQKLLREVDSSILATALQNAKDEVKERIFINMSRRSAAMIQEDMEYMGFVPETDIEDARQIILDIYFYDVAGDPYGFMSDIYEKAKNSDKKEPFDSDEERNHIVFVFQGSGNIADKVSVSLFDTYQAADNYCDFLNDLKPQKGTFVYARHAGQMVEYDVEKPLLAGFDQIFEHANRAGNGSPLGGGLFLELDGNMIIRDSLKKFNYRAILTALNGLDKKSRELLIHCLPVKIADKINADIADYDKHNITISTLNETRKARQKILVAVNKNIKEFKKGRDGKYRGMVWEVVKG